MLCASVFRLLKVILKVMSEFNHLLRDKPAANFHPTVTADLKNLREELSLSGEESINWRDFISSMMDKSKIVTEDNLQMVFAHFKKSDPNYLTVADISELVGGEKHALEIMKKVDVNSDGRIDFEEFKKMMEDEDLNVD